MEKILTRALRPKKKELSQKGECPRISPRLPHPERRKAVAVTGGRYDPVTETVRVALRFS